MPRRMDDAYNLFHVVSGSTVHEKLTEDPIVHVESNDESLSVI